MVLVNTTQDDPTKVCRGLFHYLHSAHFPTSSTSFQTVEIDFIYRPFSETTDILCVFIVND